MSIRKRIKIVITSRPQIPIKSYFPDVVEIPLDPNNQNDIVKYVHASVLELEKRGFPKELRKKIQETLIKGSDGMFLWASLLLDDLKTSTQTSPNDIQHKLESLPQALPDLYRKILLAIKPEDVETVNNILRWVFWAERPLKLQELAKAIVIKPGLRSISSLSNMKKLDFKNILRSILGALITVQDDTVYLVHQSAKEFLKEFNSITIERFSLQPDQSHLYITLSCLTYLSFDEFKAVEVIYDPISRSNKAFVDDPFFRYCSIHWPDHMRQLGDELQRTPLLKAAFLYHAQSKVIMEVAWNFYDRSRSHTLLGLKPLMIATYYGLPNLIQFLLDDGEDINHLCPHHGNALQAVVHQGKDDIVRYLVERGADVNVHDGRIGTALQAAAYNGKEDIVRFLVEHGADVNAKGGYYGTALQAAVRDGRDDIVRYHAGQEADFNAHNGRIDTTLPVAAYTGKVDTVRYPVEYGTNVNAKGDDSSNSLHAAVRIGKDDIIRYLVGRSADAKLHDSRIGTALPIIAYNGKEDIVRYLVEHGADVNVEGGYYSTALQAAACYGKDVIVRYLVEHGADINAQGGYYGNALQAAAYNGKEDVIRYLVERGADVNAEGGYCSTALQVAACGGTDDIVRYLAECGADVKALGDKHGKVA
jgi:ankyrin repeat protein